MAVNAENLARRLKNQVPADYEKAVKCIFELKALSQWDRAYIQNWYTDGVTVEEVKKAEWGKPNRIELMMTYYPSINEYNNVRTVQVIIKDYRF